MTSNSHFLLRNFHQMLCLVCLHEIVLLLANDCACKVPGRPDASSKAETARWMVHHLDWGVLSTISTRLGDPDTPPIPFGNVYSHVDGPCDNSTGVPYFYGTYMDQSFADSRKNGIVSFTLSEASLSSVCADRNSINSCSLNTQFGDPENPICGRLTVTGRLVALDKDSTEYEFAKDALFERHPSMVVWPENHGWFIAKINIQDIWLIDFYGGATVVEIHDYFAASPISAMSYDG